MRGRRGIRESKTGIRDGHEGTEMKGVRRRE